MRFARLILIVMVMVCVGLVGFMPVSHLYAQANPITLTLTVPATFSDIYSPKFLGEFEAANPGVKIQVNKQLPAIPPAAQGLDKHFEAVQQYISSGDVLYVSTSTISAESTQAGYFLNLLPLVNDDRTFNPDDFYPAIWQSYQWDNGIWALPISADPYVLLYNPDVFDKAGIPHPNDKWTVDDLLDAARKLMAQDASGKTLPGLDVLPNIQPFAFRAISKASLMDTSTVPNTPRFATPEMADLLDKWLKLDNDGGLGRDPLGKSPMSIAPALWLALKEQLFRGENRAATMLPGGQAAISVDAFAVSGGTLYPEKAYALAAWLGTRAESANTGLSSTTARKSLKNATGSSQLPFRLDITPEVQALIDQSVANAIPLAEMRYVDYLAVAYNKMKTDKVDTTAALQQAESDAVKAQQEAINQKDKVRSLLLVATPVPAGDVAPGKVGLKFAVSNPLPTIPNQEAWTKLIADFTASDPLVATIKLESSTGALEKLSQDYDCFYLPYVDLAPEKLAKILPLDPLMAADATFDSSDIVGGVMNQVTRDNRTYALPADITPEVLKYDVAAFEKAGVPAPDLLWTVDQFADALKQLKAANEDKPAFVPVNTFGSYLINLIVAYGGMPIDFRSNPPTVSFTDPATLDAIRQVTDLGKKGYFKYRNLFGGQLDLSFTPEPSLIKTASLSAYSFTALFGGAGDKDKFRLTLYPRGSKANALAYNLGTLYISANSQSPEGCYRWISAVARSTSLFGSMPVRLSLINDPELVKAQGEEVVAVYKQIATMLQDPNTVSVRAFSGGISANDLILQLELFKALDKYMAEGSSVDLEAALKESETGAQAFLGCSGSIPPLDNTSPESQKAYFKAAKECATKADPDLAVFFAGIKTD